MLIIAQEEIIKRTLLQTNAKQKKGSKYINLKNSQDSYFTSLFDKQGEPCKCEVMATLYKYHITCINI